MLNFNLKEENENLLVLTYDGVALIDPGTALAEFVYKKYKEKIANEPVQKKPVKLIFMAVQATLSSGYDLFKVNENDVVEETTEEEYAEFWQIMKLKDYPFEVTNDIKPFKGRDGEQIVWPIKAVKGAQVFDYFE